VIYEAGDRELLDTGLLDALIARICETETQA